MIRWSVLDGSGTALAAGSADNPELGWRTARNAALSLVREINETVALVMTVDSCAARIYPSSSARDNEADSLRELIDDLIDVVAPDHQSAQQPVES